MNNEGKVWVYIDSLDQGFWMTPEQVENEERIKREIREEQQKYIDSLGGTQ